MNKFWSPMRVFKYSSRARVFALSRDTRRWRRRRLRDHVSGCGCVCVCVCVWVSGVCVQCVCSVCEREIEIHTEREWDTQRERESEIHREREREWRGVLNESCWSYIRESSLLVQNRFVSILNGPRFSSDIIQVHQSGHINHGHVIASSRVTTRYTIEQS